MTKLGWIEPQFIKTGQDSRGDLDSYVVCGVHLPSGASAGVARAWKVNHNDTNGGEIPIPSEGGKVDSVTCKVLQSGAVRFVVSQAAAPGASGSTATLFSYVIPGVFPPAPPVPAGGGGEGLTFIAAPGGYIRIHEGAFDGQQTVNLASFGIPAAALLNLKVTVNAATVGARGRVGPHTGSSGAAMLATVVQAPNTRNYSFCQSAPGANNSLVLWADTGPLDEFYVDCLGWWY